MEYVLNRALHVGEGEQEVVYFYSVSIFLLVM